MYIVADIGGTNMRIAGSHDLQSFAGGPEIIPTPQLYDEGIRVIIETAQRIAGVEAIQGVAIGFAGVLSRDTCGVFSSPHLVEWGGHALGGDIAHALATEVVLENDAAMVGLGEAHFGAGKGSAILAYITVSTGVNGVRVIDGIIDRATWGFEIGAQYVPAIQSVNFSPQAKEGEICTLEESVSGTAISQRFGTHPRELGKDSPVWEDLAQTLAFGLINTIVHWSPDRIVLGGSMMNEIGIPVDRVRTHIGIHLERIPEIPEIRHSSLGDLGGLWGGLARLTSLKKKG